MNTKAILRLAIVSLAAPLALMGGQAMAANADPMQQVTQAASDIRSRIATAPDRADDLRQALARVEALRALLASQRHQQGGVLSADQQERALFKLAAILRSAS
jgi:hypothetical protein